MVAVVFFLGAWSAFSALMATGTRGAGRHGIVAAAVVAACSTAPVAVIAL